MSNTISLRGIIMLCFYLTKLLSFFISLVIFVNIQTFKIKTFNFILYITAMNLMVNLLTKAGLFYL